MLLYGASGHAKVIISILTASGIPVKALFDDDDSRKNLGIHQVSGKYESSILPGEPLIICIGDNRIRRLVAAKITHDFGTAVHPSAQIDASVRIGVGTVIMHNAVVQADTLVGEHVIINTKASVDHDCRIGDFVHIAPGATLCGNVAVGENTLVGAGSVITPNLTIGKNCLISAGSIVTQSIPDGAVVRGNPGRVVIIANA